MGTRRSAGAPAHRVIQVQVRVKLGDQVVTLVQLGNFPWEPEDFIEDGRKGELGEHWPVGGVAHPGMGPPRQPGGRREVAGDCDSQRRSGPGGAPGPDTCGEEQGSGASREEMPPAGLPGPFRVPLWEPLDPHVSKSWHCSQGQRNSLTLVFPGTTHVLCHPAHGAEQGGQVGTGHLAAHKVLQVGASSPRPLGGPGLQVVDLGFEGLREPNR